MRRLAFVVLSEFSNLGLAAAIEPLFVANWLAGQRLFDWRVISVDGAPVRASNGMWTPVDGDLTTVGDCSTFFLLASFEPRQATRVKSITRWLRRLGLTPVEIGGIENGTQALAEAGLLNGHAAAVHWDNVAGFQELYPQIAVVAQRYTFSGNRITCPGSAATLDMMVEWLGRHADATLASEVAKHLLVAPPDEQAFDHAGSDAVVTRAQALMRLHIEEPLSCAQVASQLDVSLRQLERRFKRELGRSVNQHYMLLRIEKAHQFLQQTELSVTHVAISCGFRSVEYFAKIYRMAFGCRPSADRRQTTLAPVFRPR